MKGLYLDSSVIIYAIEGEPGLRQAALAHLRRAAADAVPCHTSLVSRLECRVRPLRWRDSVTLAHFEGFFARPPLTLLDVSPAVLDRAAELRAESGFKTADAIHLASAELAGNDVFLTGDARLARFQAVRVEIVSLDPA